MRNVKTSFAVMLIFLMFLGVVAGCTKEPAGPEVPSVTRDTLKVAITSEPPSLTIEAHDSLISVGFNIMTYSGLVRIDHGTLQIKPDLAHSWRVENETDWIFELNKGVTFHNGLKFTADDVVATIEFAKTVPGSSGYTSNMKSVVALDEHTVKITTYEPYAGLLYDLGYHYNFIIPSSLIKSGHDFNKSPIGTGPYKLTEWRHGESLKFEAFEDYFDSNHKPRIKYLEFKVIPEGAARTIALEAGEVDFVWDVSSPDVARLKTNSNITVLEVETVDNVQLFLNVDKTPLDDVNFRLAIAHAINRQNIVDGVLNGLGTPNYTLISQGFWGSTNANAVSYDLEKARAYLAAWGGDPSAVRIPILASNETRVAIATVIQGSLADIGIPVEVISMDTATYFARWVAGDYVGILASWSPSNSLTYVQRYHSDRRIGRPGALNSPEVDALVIQAQGTINDDARLLLIQEIVSEVNKLAPQISLYQSVWVRAYDKNLQGVVCSGTGYTAYNDMYWGD